MCAWYEQSFGKDYLTVYKHRDLQGAYEEVRQMMDWLDLPQGAEILDLCCGMGRHSMVLSEFGYRVTGMDLSPVLLNEAKKLDHQRKVHWIQGDMRHIPIERTFDAVVNLFTSFGYFETDQENNQVVLEMERVLKPSGKFIIDFLNPDYVIEHLVPFSKRSTEGVEIEENRAIEDGFVKKWIALREADQAERRYLEQVRLYSLSDFESMLKKTELQINHVFGNYDQSVYNKDKSPRLIIMGHKKG